MKFVLLVWLISKASMAITSAQFDDLEKVPRGLAYGTSHKGRGFHGFLRRFVGERRPSHRNVLNV
jgi:hypothetical protein